MSSAPITMHFDAAPVRLLVADLARKLDAGFPASMTATANRMSRSLRLNFERGGRPTPWEPVSGYTLARRKVNKQNQPLLDERKLFRSLIATRGGVPYSAFEQTPTKLTVGTSREGAGRNQKQRPFLMFQEADLVEIPLLFRPELAGLVRQAASDLLNRT